LGSVGRFGGLRFGLCCRGGARRWFALNEFAGILEVEGCVVVVVVDDVAGGRELYKSICLLFVVVVLLLLLTWQQVAGEIESETSLKLESESETILRFLALIDDRSIASIASIAYN